MDRGSIEALGLSEGEMVKIRASGSTDVRCFARLPRDKNIGNAKNVIRIDKADRAKIGASVGDMVIVQRP
jgi:formylmethanofuran dehydrogenase subunit D